MIESSVRIAGQWCPLCHTEVFAERLPVGGQRVCEGYEAGVDRHGPVLLSWAWRSEEEYEAWYADPIAYHTEEAQAIGCPPYEDRYEEHRKAAISRLYFLDALRGTGRFRTVLDIGAGNGAFVDAACAAGYEARGLDPAPMGGRVLRGTWRDVQGLWDVLTMHDVLEHLTRPRQCLERLRSHMGHTSLLVIEMPEWDGPHQREHGYDWRHIKPRQHLCLYSRGAAEQMYEECGFEVVSFDRPLRGTIGKMRHTLQRTG